MILKASQRGGAMELAVHLMKPENEHVEVHELRGFVANDLAGAFKEVQAISLGTRCKQMFFSVSLNPPEGAIVPTDVFEVAVERIEAKMGLEGQPRALVFHEKEGRRHAHCVWSRIDAAEMKAVNLPHFKMKLNDIARELFLENDWQLPRGFLNSAERDPLAFGREESQQALRAKADPRVIKQLFKEAWAVSDSRNAFAAALSEHGYRLAKGDRRGHVAVDWCGEVYAISRWTGVKAKDVRARLGPPDILPSVSETKQTFANEHNTKIEGFRGEVDAKRRRDLAAFERKRTALVTDHRKARATLKGNQRIRKVAETRSRAARIPKGLKALWFRVTGLYSKLRQKNEAAFEESEARDLAERQGLIDRQLKERRNLQHEKAELRHRHDIIVDAMKRDIEEWRRAVRHGLEASSPDDDASAPRRSRRGARDRSP